MYAPGFHPSKHSFCQKLHLFIWETHNLGKLSQRIHIRFSGLEMSRQHTFILLNGTFDEVKEDDLTSLLSQFTIETIDASSKL